MSLVKFENIEKALDKVDSLDDASVEKLSETYTLAQTELVNYIMQATLEYENEDLGPYIIYYFCIAMESFQQAGIELDRITDDIIDGFHDEFMDVLEEYTREEDPQILDTYINQPNLLAFLAEELDGEDEDGEELDIETSSQLFIVLSAMTGLLNRAIKK